MNFLRRISIRSKIIVVTMLTAAAALLLTGTALFWYEVRGLESKLGHDLTTAAGIISANSVAAISFGDPSAATEILAALRAEPQIVQACIYDRSGKPFAVFSRDQTQTTVPPRAPAEGIVRDGQRMIYCSAIQDEREHERVGTLYIEAGLQGARERLRSYAELLLLVMALSCLVALCLSALLQRYISGPIVKLVGTMGEVSARSDYSLRVPQDRSDEFGQLAASFNEMLHQIQSAYQQLEAFSYSVSHDLRAPLRTISGFSDVLSDDYGSQLPEDARRILEKIRASAARMSQLINDLLEFARFSRQTIRRQQVDTAALVRSVLASLHDLREGREVDIRVGELPPCEGDASLLNQVWINLISNALKYSRKREVAIIEIGCERRNGVPTYFVRDNGAGFEPRQADRLFGVFQRLHSERDYEGTGVGLAIVHRIVTRHGGRIWAEAEVDRGATFYFTLEKEPETRPAKRGQAEI